MRRVYQTEESRSGDEKVRISIIKVFEVYLRYNEVWFGHYTQKVSFMKSILGKFNHQLFSIFNYIFNFYQRVGICLFWIYSSR
jgi:hypothetical protein